MSHDTELLQQLDDLLRRDAMIAQIGQVVRHVERKLVADPAAVMAWEPIPLAIYGTALPAGLLSSWVFILRAGATTGAERHPNSHQRVVAWRGSGDLQVWAEDHWISNLLTDDPDAPVAARWASIAPDVWHQAVVASRDWAVVSFHTVTAHELIEERPTADDFADTRQRHYISE
jgi:hypothetical protein